MKTDFDIIVRPLISQSNAQKTERFNSLLTGWVSKGDTALDIGCNVGETTNRLKELGALPCGIGSCRAAIAYAANKYSSIPFVTSDELAYLSNIHFFVDCICMRTYLLGLTEEAIKSIISVSKDRLKTGGVLILNLDYPELIETITTAYPELGLAYKADYRTTGKESFCFAVFKKHGGADTDE